MSGIFSWLKRTFPILDSGEGRKARKAGPNNSKPIEKRAVPKAKLPRRVGARANKAAAQAGAIPAAAPQPGLQLTRSAANPILSPHELNDWETQATFNPAALAADGKVHLIYRAIGKDNVSVLGYAMTHDGIHVHERRADPAFFSRRKDDEPKVGAPIDYLSGGGGDGGCEDPRLTVIDDVVYLLYTAFDGWNSIRIALSTIPLEDFLNRSWNWSEPVLISPPGEIHKNWSLFPEKINGKYAVLSNISPNIRVNYFDSLEDLKSEGQKIRLEYTKVTRKKVWDTWVRGAGPPPLKTKKGWLILYHAMDASDPNRYKLGAMLLDLKDPTKVLYRSSAPILEPDECYENEGFKAGVVYSCGAVILDGKLYVYYGGADTVTCVAVADLKSFLDELTSGGAPKVRGVAKPKGKTYDHVKTVKKKSARLA